MASKTGRTWLDCKNPQMADHFLRLAVKVNKKWAHSLREKAWICASLEQTEIWCFFFFFYKWVYMLYSQSLETLYSQLTTRGDAAADSSSSKADVEKDLLRILSCQAESVSMWCDVRHLRCECSCDIWQLRKCCSDRLAAWSVRQLKCEPRNNESGGGGDLQLLTGKRHIVRWHLALEFNSALLRRPWLRGRTKKPWPACSAAKTCCSGYQKM